MSLNCPFASSSPRDRGSPIVQKTSRIGVSRVAAPHDAQPRPTPRSFRRVPPWVSGFVQAVSQRRQENRCPIASVNRRCDILPHPMRQAAQKHPKRAEGYTRKRRALPSLATGIASMPFAPCLVIPACASPCSSPTSPRTPGRSCGWRPAWASPWT
jgi:hypothetical protein